MKILSIRGTNLASLERIELDLAAGPLASAGLFAITGPTGAGKSTLLDAMCLALFGKTPRLSDRGGVEIGLADEEHRLGAMDVRNLVRRGATAATAEVEFLDQDDKRYLAKWSVRRARDKADGKFQNQDRTLIDVATGQVVCSGAKQVSDAVAQRLGLTFDQFMRSALLAQGDFAAFLKAKADERAELLEKVTGTSIYGELSKLAHQKASDLKNKIDLEARQLEGITPLTEAEREALAAALTERTAAHGLANAEVERLEGAERWHGELAKKRTLEREAEAQLAEAVAAVEALAPRELVLKQVADAQPLRPTLAEADRLAGEQAGAEQALAGLAREVGVAAEALAKAQEAHSQAGAAKAAAAKALTDAQPALTEARGLDAQLAAQRKLVGDAEATVEACRGQAAEADAKALEAANVLADCRATITRARAWRSASLGIEVLATKWGRWNHLLESLTEIQRDLDAGAKQGKDTEKALKKVVGALAKAEAEQLTAAEALTKAQAALTDAEGRVAALALPEVRRQREMLEARRTALHGLKALADEAVRADEERAAKAAEAAAARVHARDAAERQAAATKAGTLAEGGLAEAQRALERLEATKSLEQHRADLVAGEACPLCGATEHPYASAAPVVKEEIAALKKRIKALQKEKTDAAKHQGEAENAVTEAEARTSRADARVAELAARLEALQAEYAVQRPVAALEGLPDQVGAAAQAAVATHQGALEAELARLAGTERAADEARAAAEEARRALTAGQQAADKAAKSRHDAELKHQEEKLKQGQVKSLEAGLLERRQQALAQLAPAFEADAGWQARWAKDPAAFARASQEQVATWDANQDEERRAMASEAALAAQLQVAEAAQGVAREALSKAETQHQGLAESLAALETRRQALLGGQPAEVAEAALQGAIHAAEAQLSAAGAAVTTATAAAAAAEARHQEAVAAAALLATRLAEAQRTLTTRLAQAGLALEELRGRLVHDQAWIDQERQALDAIKALVTTANATLVERRDQRLAHEAGNRPAVEAEAIEARLAEARAAREHRLTELNEARFALQRDGEARTTHAAQLEKIAKMRADAAVWEQLRELIGSADGKKFRAYAQGLTLTMLLDLANVHLDELRPRYRLMKVPGEELELQVVDRDMGHEVRSAHSLSGGETFLISLALALALSSFASKRQRIRSLFIDEGFGSLDAQTLEDAIATLDALQAQGRQVGLISHVPGLGERLGVQVKVTPIGGGRSAMTVDAGGPGVLERCVPAPAGAAVGSSRAGAG